MNRFRLSQMQRWPIDYIVESKNKQFLGPAHAVSVREAFTHWWAWRKVSNFLAVLQTSSSHSLQLHQVRCVSVKFHIVLPLQEFVIDFSLCLFVNILIFLKNTFSTIPILGNITAEDKFLYDTIITNIWCIKNPFRITFYLTFTTLHEVDNYFLCILTCATEIQN